MKGQFYFLSIVLYATVVGAIAFVLLQPQPPLLKPLGEGVGFNIYNLEEEIENTLEVGMALGSGADDFSLIEEIVRNYTIVTRDESLKMGLSVAWTHNVTGSVSNATMNYTLVVTGDKFKFSDRFTVNKALLLLVDSWYSENYTHVNMSVHNESGRVTGLSTSAFGVLTDGNQISVQEIGDGYYGNRSEILSIGVHTVSANVTGLRSIVARETDTFTVS